MCFNVQFTLNTICQVANVLLATQPKSERPTKSGRKNKLGVSKGASEGARVALCRHHFWLITFGGISSFLVHFAFRFHYSYFYYPPFV